MYFTIIPDLEERKSCCGGARPITSQQVLPPIRLCEKMSSRCETEFCAR